MYHLNQNEGTESAEVATSGTTIRLNETRFGPKKTSSPIYLGPKNLDTF